jgi:Uma2 family endonuclease
MQKLLAAEEFAQLPEPPDEFMDEFVHRRIIQTPRPKKLHGIVRKQIEWFLNEFVRKHHLGHVFHASGIIISRNPETVRGPDVYYYSKERLPQLPKEDGFFEEIPDLVVEVVSPSDSRTHLQEKLWEYIKAGVRLVWIIDPKTRTVDAFHSLDRMQHLEHHQMLEGGEVLPGFTCPISKLFE